MVRRWLATSVVVLAGLAGAAADASARGTIVIYSEWLADCDDCTPSGGVDLAVQTASGSFRNLYRLERRLGAGFVVGPLKSRLFVYPAIAQDGRWIAHVTRSSGLVARRIDLARQRPVGRARRLVQFGTGDSLTAIAWSPDGRSLALGGRIQGGEGVWIVGRDGTGVRAVLCGCDPRLEQPDTRITDVAWAPGPALAVMTDSDTSGRGALYQLTPDGISLRKLSSHDPDEHEDPAWSPGGGSVAVERHRSLTRSDIVVIDARTLISRRALTHAWGPAWSPDASRMAFIEEGGTGTWQVGRDRIRHFRRRGPLADLDANQLAWLSARPPRVRAATAAEDQEPPPGQ